MTEVQERAGAAYPDDLERRPADKFKEFSLKQHGPPDHLTASAAIRVARNEADQLLGEIEELCKRLAPQAQNRPQEAGGVDTGAEAVTRCELGGEIMGIEYTLQTARSLIGYS